MTDDFLNPAPADPSGPPRRMTREDLEEMAAYVGKDVEFHFPGRIIEDPEGNLIGVEAPETGTATFAGVTITFNEAVEFSIYEGQIPGVSISE